MMITGNEIGTALCETLGLPKDIITSMTLYLDAGTAAILEIETIVDISEEDIETTFSRYELVETDE